MRRPYVSNITDPIRHLSSSGDTYVLHVTVHILHSHSVHRVEIAKPFAVAPNARANASVPTGGTDNAPRPAASVESAPGGGIAEARRDMCTRVNAAFTLAGLRTGGFTVATEHIDKAVNLFSASTTSSCTHCRMTVAWFTSSFLRHPHVCPYHCDTAFTLAPIRGDNTIVNNTSPTFVGGGDATQAAPLTLLPSIFELLPIGDVRAPSPPWSRLVPVGSQDVVEDAEMTSRVWAGEDACSTSDADTDSTTEADAIAHRPASDLPLRSSLSLGNSRHSPYSRSAWSTPMWQSPAWPMSRANSLSLYEDESSSDESAPPETGEHESSAPSSLAPRATCTPVIFSPRRGKGKKKLQLGAYMQNAFYSSYPEDRLAGMVDPGETSAAESDADMSAFPRTSIKFCRWKTYDSNDRCAHPYRTVDEAIKHAKVHYQDAVEYSAKEGQTWTSIATLKCRWDDCSLETTKESFGKHLLNGTHLNIGVICDHCGKLYSRVDSMRRHYINGVCPADVSASGASSSKHVFQERD